MQLEFSQMFGFGEKPPPPTSKEVIENLPSEVLKNKGLMPLFA